MDSICLEKEEWMKEKRFYITILCHILLTDEVAETMNNVDGYPEGRRRQGLVAFSLTMFL